MRAAASLSYGHREDRTPTHGYEPTREAAMAAFAKAGGGNDRASRDQDALDSLGHPCERLPARFRDPHAHNASLSTVGDHALALRGCESGLDQFDHHVDRESVRTQDRLGVTVTAPCKQFEGAAAPVRTQDRLGVTVTAPCKQFEGAAAVRIGAAGVVWPSRWWAQ